MPQGEIRGLQSRVAKGRDEVMKERKRADTVRDESKVGFAVPGGMVLKGLVVMLSFVLLLLVVLMLIRLRLF